MAISVPVDIDLQIKKAIEDTNELVGGINKSLSGVEKQAKATGIAVSGIAFIELARAAIDFGKTIASVFEKAIDEAIEADNAIQGLASSLKASGSFSEQNVKVFEDLAKSLSEVSRFSDEAILNAFRIGKQFGLSNRETAKFGKAAVELASFLGQDLDTTARQLGQTFDGTAGRIAEQVPALRGLSEEALKAGGALDVVLKVAGGSAIRDLDKFSVQVEKLKQAFGDIFEELGSSVVKNPALINSLKIIGGLFRDIAVAVGENDEIFKTFISGSLSAMVKGFYVVSQIVEAVNNAFFKIARFLEPAVQALESFDKATESLKKGDIRGFAKSLDVVTATRDRFKEIDKLAERDTKLFDKFNTALSEVQAAIDKAADGQERLTKEAEKTGLQFDKNGDKSNRNAETYSQMMERIKAAQSGAFERLKKNTAEMEKQTEELKKQNDEFKSQLEQTSKNVGDIIKPIKDGDFNKLGLSNMQRQFGAFLVGGVSQALQGRQGAVNSISLIAENLGQRLLGVPGIGGLVGFLAQPKDVVREQVKAFIDAIPEIIDTIAENIPVLIEALAAKADRIAIALAKALVFYLPPSLVEGARRFVSEILRGAGEFIGKILEGAGRFIEELANKIGEALQRLIDNLNPVKGIGNGVGSQLGSISGNGIGGSIGNFLNPVGAVAGRGVQAVADTVSNFLGFGKTGGFTGGGFTSSAIAGGGGNQQAAVVKVQIGQRDLATAILDLNRQGFRT